MKNRYKMVITIVTMVIILICIFIYGLFRYEWNNYAISKIYEIQGMSGVIEKGDLIIFTTINPYLFISNDAGKTWSIKMFNLNEYENIFDGLGTIKETISFVSKKNSDGDTSPQYLYISTDNGSNWSKKNIEKILPFNRNLSNESLSINSGILECYDFDKNVTYYSSDYGKTWKETNHRIDELKNVKFLKTVKNNTYFVRKYNKKTNEFNLLFSIKKEFEINLFGDIIFDR